MFAIHQAISADGTRIVYRAAGNRDNQALVLLHGWAQSSACWGDGVIDSLAESYRVLALDLRGHGYSDAPAAGYDDSQRWADDVAAVLLRDAARDPVLVGWSYGGLVACDYLAVHGVQAVAGLVLVGAVTSLGRDHPGAVTGDAMKRAIPGAFSEVPRDAIRALGGFGTALVPERLSGELGAVQQALFGASLATPPRVREALFRRSVDHDEMLGGLKLAALVIHGTEDQVVALETAKHNAEMLLNAHASFWADSGHAPFVENPGRFVEEISNFVGSLRRDASDSRRPGAQNR
ncbi:alpha/beta fold hydrolase [Hoyosella altamirensis]|uniref:Non-heme chloroperoxidase n=1 Tax=Hoyosella altamirensis TaxID=616997 RepID=A0A839RMS3_9ACTN|nr:alpha/beta hydrolase [Hoyosella altamirensis]MBB3037498.1 non-heme chloroperoxidase [Hoyosella altamirensis]